MQKLSVLLRTLKKDWVFSWLKMIKGMYYIKSGDVRVYFNVVPNQIVICHICRKTTQKAKANDNEIALAHWKEFIGG